MKLIFESEAWAEYLELMAGEPAAFTKLHRLIQECLRAPFSGTGKPEPLKGELQGYWSRRITQEHRLVYRVSGKGDEQRLEIVQCRLHY